MLCDNNYSSRMRIQGESAPRQDQASLCWKHQALSEGRRDVQACNHFSFSFLVCLAIIHENIQWCQSLKTWLRLKFTCTASRRRSLGPKSQTPSLGTQKEQPCSSIPNTPLGHLGESELGNGMGDWVTGSMSCTYKLVKPKLTPGFLTSCSLLY